MNWGSTGISCVGPALVIWQLRICLFPAKVSIFCLKHLHVFSSLADSFLQLHGTYSATNRGNTKVGSSQRPLWVIGIHREMSQAYCSRVKDTFEAHSTWFLRGNPVGWALLTHSNTPQITLPYILFFPSLNKCLFLTVCLGEMPAQDINLHKEGLS